MVKVYRRVAAEEEEGSAPISRFAACSGNDKNRTFLPLIERWRSDLCISTVDRVALAGVRWLVGLVVAVTFPDEDDDNNTAIIASTRNWFQMGCSAPSSAMNGCTRTAVAQSGWCHAN